MKVHRTAALVLASTPGSLFLLHMGKVPPDPEGRIALWADKVS